MVALFYDLFVSAIINFLDIGPSSMETEKSHGVVSSVRSSGKSRQVDRVETQLMRTLLTLEKTRLAMRKRCGSPN